eukprot:2262_1
MIFPLIMLYDIHIQVLQDHYNHLWMVYKVRSMWCKNIMQNIISEWASTCCAPFDGYDTSYAAVYLIYVAKYFQERLYPKQEESILKWMSYWYVSDVFEEAGFNSNEFNGLYGLQTIRGVAKPAFRAMEMLNKFGGNVSYDARVISQDMEENSTVLVYCLRNDNGKDRYSVFVANFNSQKLQIEAYDMVIYVNNQKGKQLSDVRMYRIDGNNTNPIVAWKNMSSPLYPSQSQLKTINDTSQLIQMDDVNWKRINSTTNQITLNIPVYGVALLDLQY